jgi:hypothetical protein
MTGHRWSGWPGAWCLDCGCDDPNELALADNNIVYVGEPVDEYGNQMWTIDPAKRHLYGPDDCPEPGSNRHNPYVPSLLAGE